MHKTDTLPYPKYYPGTFRTIKNLIMVILLTLYFTGSWITWQRSELQDNSRPSHQINHSLNPLNQAIYINVPERKAYIFNIEIWSDEIYYMVGILVLSALGLFIFTSIFGRLWCGFTCPHTIFTDIFVKIERLCLEGIQNYLIQCNIFSLKITKQLTFTAKHVLWLLVSISFAYGWVCYFYGARKLSSDIITFSLSQNATIWLISLSSATYIFAGFIKDKVCIYFCPYGRFQSAFIENTTLVVNYNDWRGEPRKHSKDIKENHGDCINCMQCLYACPMKIDIRDGLQMACIGCGLCIDACNTIMEKIQRPLNLISYDSQISSQEKKQNTNNKASKQAKKKHSFLYFIKGKIIILVFASFVSIGIMSYAIIQKEELGVKINKIYEPQFTNLPDGGVRNEYILHIENRSGYNLNNIKLSLKGLPEVLFAVQIANVFKLEYKQEFYFNLKLDEDVKLPIFVKAPKELKIDTIEKNLQMNFIISYNLEKKNKIQEINRPFIFRTG